MSETFSKILRIIEKTGDKCIVFEEKTDDAYVVMSLDAYDKIVSNNSHIASLTEDQLLNKINSDIALWKSNQETDIVQEKFSDESFKTPLTAEETKSADTVESGINEDESERYYFEPVEKDE